ncbi:MAG: bifunctional 2-C-methyl-D-erythritol 4-phosphate cytidylyltransferase/2-C-methyl-D-erythritol 2,4-cyclodiphosphate synthase [Rhizobiales bacterium PAR1]|nr:MAG: bifunctional 2-C-methyl-D-erythritol 4-phosphate cytidylyltransferase/2-C-methyl-D-erythritol 2,4-cyclodiphosphate synthase [Rhizobiales bacterium PAR1]
MTALSSIAALIVAAGRGARVGGAIPKQYRIVADKTVLAHTLAAFGAVESIDRIVTVIHPDDSAEYETAARKSTVTEQRLASAFGGTSRQASVRLGLEALANAGFPADGLVLIHDAARPFASEALLSRAILAAARHGAAIPVLPVPDTLAIVDSEGRLAGNHDRAMARTVQTPQAFRFELILGAHRRAAADGRESFTDDASLAAAYGTTVHTFAGDAALFKITEERDFLRAEHHLSPLARETRTGIGYDVHAFTEGDHVWLGGVRIPHSHALLGHSDADPVLHAITDALLGTIGDGDIGMHFPPSDEKWRGAASHLFLADAARRVTQRGGRIVSVDCTVVCEAPKVGPHRAVLQAEIGRILRLSAERVGVKATTSERLGFTGRREGIAAIAIASVAF